MGEATQLIQNIAADPNAAKCSTDQLLEFLSHEEDPGSFWHNLSLQNRSCYAVTKQHEGTGLMLSALCIHAGD